jgi:hypothetical protein
MPTTSSGVSSMEKTDPHMTHNYSHEQIIKFAYTQEIYHVRKNPKYDNVREIIEQYMQDRVKEITDRWK